MDFRPLFIALTLRLSLIHICTAADIIALLCEKLPFMAGADFTPEIAKVLDSKKVSDHHAIIPTMELAKADPCLLYTSAARHFVDKAENQFTLAPRVTRIYHFGNVGAVHKLFNGCLLYTSQGKELCGVPGRKDGYKLERQAKDCR